MYTERCCLLSLLVLFLYLAPYVKVYVMEGKRCLVKKKTRTARRTLEPLYQQQLEFKVEFTGKTLHPLSVSIQPSGKKRLILDLRHVNLYVFKRKFRYEDVSVALQIFSQGFFLFKFDLKSGYRHDEIFPDHRKYLVFSWDSGDGL